ncbi:FecR domain-containing protein [Roseibium sp. M-1]
MSKSRFGVTGALAGFIATALCLVLFAVLSPAMAQPVPGCTRAELPNPPRVVFQCANGLVIEAEAASAFRIDENSGQIRPDGVDVSGEAVLIDVDPGSGPFQVRTPHAIAAVRGTVYAVDVSSDRTSVFVVRGHVAVSRPDGSDEVVLAPGEGVDVSPGVPFTPATWSQERAAGLLSRFAR